MRLKSLSSRLFVVTAVALLPAVAIAIANIITIQRDRITELHGDAMRTAELVSLEVEQTFAGLESVLRTLAAAPVVRNANGPACSALLADTVKAVPFASELYILNADGSLRCGSSTAEHLDLVSKDLLAETTTENLVSGTYQKDAKDGAERLPVALRIGGGGNGASGIALALVDLAWMEERLQARSMSPGNSLTIVDRSGTVLARVPDPETFVGTKIRPEFMPLLEETTPGSMEMVSRDGTPRILGYYPPAVNSSGLYISAGYSIEEGLATLRSVVLQALGLAVLGTVLVAMLALYTARVFIAQPVGALIETITAWRRGNTAARTGMSEDNGEIGEAGAALDAFLSEVIANREARQKADEARDLMRDELEHREKNLLATIQAVARQTFADTGNDTALRVFSDRLHAISEANRLLKQSGWKSTSLRHLISNGVATFIGTTHDRVETKGPDLVVKGNVATAIGMSIHELCTNAVKYGALSNDTGKILIEWQLQPSDKGQDFTLQWTEHGGPPVTRPERTGFGSKVIKHALSAQTGGTVEIIHDPAGLVCRLTAPAEAVVAPAAA
ncbi:HWE histidine kinase domain-containing protein [Tabrizicola sp.]|uniref:sensor histidine kinase n=1 Tax=Tabrizicola sp. TaxID=2005166 RepID=UPI0025E0D722|nr:HWE histidine kinase domain-containing protein [Tabrizicola sp.]